VFGAAPRLHVRGLSVRIRIPDSELQRLDGSQPIVGMPVGTFIETAPRTVMAYLMQPIREQIERTLRGG
jgi:HlyD family secretion protein